VLIKYLFKKVYKKSAVFFNLILFSVGFIEPLFSQISLNYPKNRMVLQRNAQNKASIFIEGTFAEAAEKVEARLISLDNAGLPIVPEVASNWTAIAFCPQNNGFSGALFDQGAGWYNLEVRTINLGVIIENSSAIKVGIGEVFVVSGQSNATGIVLNREPDNVYTPTDDRVNCINLFDNTTVPAPEMEFSHLEKFSNIAPQGVSAWCWGVFGQAVASNWNVPVLIFNTAIGNTSIFAWRASALGETDPCGSSPETCMPYYYLKKTLTNYVQKTGIRSILWHQGENDNGNFQGPDLTGEVYFSNIKKVIDKSRADYQNNISWVIAKVSRVDNSTNSRVTDGQQLMIDEPNYNTYLGPLSDNIQPSGAERDNNHFWGQGLVDLGNAFFNSVNNANFLNNSTPQAGKFTLVGFNAIKSGDWNDPTTWSGGIVPSLNDDVIICNGQVITLNAIGHAKSLTLNGELQFGEFGELKFNE
jgi:hypothetical protein